MQKAILINLLLIVLELPLILGIYGLLIIPSILMIIYSIIIIKQYPADFVSMAILLIMGILAFLMLTIFPIILFAKSANRRNKFIAFLKWHTNTEIDSVKNDVVCGLLKIYGLLIFALIGVFFLWNLL